jgi:hypothetical protein
MKPSIGRTVIVKGAIVSNGIDEHPAVINRTWGGVDPGAAVNVMIFPDCGQPTCRTSIPFFPDRGGAEVSGFPVTCFPPDRV